MSKDKPVVSWNWGNLWKQLLISGVVIAIIGGALVGLAYLST